jgi:hypothetical protein
MFFPGPIERGVERLGWAADASTEQKQKINAIAQKAADDIFRAAGEASGGAQTSDRHTGGADRRSCQGWKALRADQMKLAETATRTRHRCGSPISPTCSPPAQRAELGQRVERWQRWFRG